MNHDEYARRLHRRDNLVFVVYVAVAVVIGVAAWMVSPWLAAVVLFAAIMGLDVIL